jgi:hypothetical protein
MKGMVMMNNTQIVELVDRLQDAIVSVLVETSPYPSAVDIQNALNVIAISYFAQSYIDSGQHEIEPHMKRFIASLASLAQRTVQDIAQDIGGL